jgi:hypothetical protein
MTRKYFDFYLTVGEDFSIESRFTARSEEQRKKTGKINIDQDLNDRIELLKDGENRGDLDDKQISDVGKQLYEAFFSDPIGGEFATAFGNAKKEGAGLRLLLNTPPKLSDFPWEVMNNGKNYVSTDIETPFSRILPGKNDAIPLLRGKTPRVLSILSNVEAKYGVDVQTEYKHLNEAFKKNKNIGGWEDVGPATIENIIDVLKETRIDNKIDPYNIIHFLGHGIFNEDEKESALALPPGKQDEEICKVTGSRLRHRIFDKEEALGLIVLNACSTGKILGNFSGLVPELIQIVPAVVAMRQAIEKEAAKKFTKTFYSNLNSEDIDVTMQIVRSEILETSKTPVDFLNPVLYLGHNKDKGQTVRKIFDRSITASTQFDPAANLTYRERTIQFFINLHDVSKSLESKLMSFTKYDEQKLKIMADLNLEEWLFKDFTENLTRVQVGVCDNFSHSSVTWSKQCDLLSQNINRIITVIKDAKTTEVGPSIDTLTQEYQLLEKLFAHIVIGKRVGSD